MKWYPIKYLQCHIICHKPNHIICHITYVSYIKPFLNDRRLYVYIYMYIRQTVIVRMICTSFIRLINHNKISHKANYLFSLFTHKINSFIPGLVHTKRKNIREITNHQKAHVTLFFFFFLVRNNPSVQMWDVIIKDIFLINCEIRVKMCYNWNEIVQL